MRHSSPRCPPGHAFIDGAKAQRRRNRCASAGGNRKGYAGYEFEPVTIYAIYDARGLTLNGDLGRWTSRNQTPSTSKPASQPTSWPQSQPTTLPTDPCCANCSPWQSGPLHWRCDGYAVSGWYLHIQAYCWLVGTESCSCIATLCRVYWRTCNPAGKAAGCAEGTPPGSIGTEYIIGCDPSVMSTWLSELEGINADCKSECCSDWDKNPKPIPTYPKPGRPDILPPNPACNWPHPVPSPSL